MSLCGKISATSESLHLTLPFILKESGVDVFRYICDIWWKWDQNLGQIQPYSSSLRDSRLILWKQQKIKWKKKNNPASLLAVLTWSFWDRALVSTFHEGLSPSVTILFLPPRIRKMEREGADHAARGPSSLYVPLLNAHWIAWLIKVKSLSRVWLFVTPWTVAYQAPPSMGFSRQEYWSALPFPSPGDLLDPGIEPRSPALRAGIFPSEPPGKPSRLVIGAELILQPFCYLMESTPLLRGGGTRGCMGRQEG